MGFFKKKKLAGRHESKMHDIDAIDCGERAPASQEVKMPTSWSACRPPFFLRYPVRDRWMHDRFRRAGRPMYAKP